MHITVSMSSKFAPCQCACDLHVMSMNLYILHCRSDNVEFCCFVGNRVYFIPNSQTL